MRIYDLRAEDGSLRAFEVDSILLSRRRACRIAESIVGAKLVRTTRLFRDTDDFCEFTVNGHTFIIEELFGDNSRYWVGSKEVPTVTTFSKVRHAFASHRTLEAPLRILLLVLLVLGAWLLAQPIGTFVAQDRCLDRGGRWNFELQACEHSDRQ